MSNHPANLALRFLLELAALGGLAYWGWTEHQGPVRWLLGVGLPFSAAIVWGAFRVPADHGKGLVAVPGWLRLLLEAVVLGGAVAALALAGATTAARLLGAALIIHYLVSWDRIRLLLRAR
ncbi:MAG: DUF2568 domain-containing protein [Candidatus Promineifilaceae bacterium]|nr:DUF2568 domain-containing protein [Candidatus Promineifilaceae bacterium]